MSIASIGPAAGSQYATSPTSNSEDARRSPFAALFAATAEPQTEQSSAPESASQRLHAQQQLANSLAPLPGETVDLTTIRDRVEAALSNWHSQVIGKLQEAGVDVNRSIRLHVRPADGRIEVVGDHPDKATIEEVLNEDAELANTFRAISATLDLLRATDAHIDFARAYERNPVAAVAQYSHLFDDTVEPSIDILLDQYEARADD